MNSTVDETDQPVWDNFNLFASTTESEKEETITFQRKIPEWLKGTLYRNGVGANEINNDPALAFNHAFDGFAFIQKYNIDGPSQTVRFRASFIKSYTYTNSIKTGRLAYRQFGTDPCKSIFGRFQAMFFPGGPRKFTDDTGVTIQRVNNELLALTELPIGNIIDSETLETVGPLTVFPYAKPLDSEMLSLNTAHVMYDTKRKITIGYSSRITHKEHWLDIIFISDDNTKEEKKDDDDEDGDDWISANDRFIHLTSSTNDRAREYNRRIRSNTRSFRYSYEQASYMHSASITEDYLILTEIPYHFNTFYAIWNGMFGKVATEIFKWDGDTMPTFFRVISLDTGEQVARIPGPAFFTFHHINAYQTADNKKKIVVDICAYDDPRVINELYLNKLRENIFPSGFGYVRRFELDLDGNTCSEPNANTREPQGAHCISYAHSLVPVQIELARINPRFVGKLYRYVYVVRGVPGRIFDMLLKLDVESKEQVGSWEEPCTSPSEPIFVPRPDASDDEEDDGVVLSIVLDQKSKRSFLLILDGMTFKELARAYLPVHIPLSFHGNFYSA